MKPCSTLPERATSPGVWSTQSNRATVGLPEFAGDENIHVEDSSLEALVEPYVRQAITQGELPPQTDAPTVIRLTTSIFTGVVMNLHLTEPELIGPLCRKHLQLLWKGLWTDIATP